MGVMCGAVVRLAIWTLADASTILKGDRRSHSYPTEQFREQRGLEIAKVEHISAADVRARSQRETRAKQ